jgi:hypothetical protein
MFKRTSGFILLILLVITGIGSQVSNTTLESKERRILVDQLKDTKNAFIKSTKGLSEEQLNFKKSIDKWSIKECMQHIALAEKGLWSVAHEALKLPANSVRRSEIKITDEEISKVGNDRTAKQQAPESLKPEKAKWTSAKEITESFKEDRAALIKYVKTTTLDVRNHVTDLAVGPVDAYQVMLLIAAHSDRHIQQIEEIKRDPKFPK